MLPFGGAMFYLGLYGFWEFSKSVRGSYLYDIYKGWKESWERWKEMYISEYKRTR